jgi:hypothetical protein
MIPSLAPVSKPVSARDRPIVRPLLLSWVIGGKHAAVHVMKRGLRKTKDKSAI